MYVHVYLPIQLINILVKLCVGLGKPSFCCQCRKQKTLKINPWKQKNLIRQENCPRLAKMTTTIRLFVVQMATQDTDLTSNLEA